jgi:hypothetical protein
MIAAIEAKSKLALSAVAVLCPYPQTSRVHLSELQSDRRKQTETTGDPWSDLDERTRGAVQTFTTNFEETK